MVATTGELPLLMAVKLPIVPDPLAAKPIVELLLVQLKIVPATDPENDTAWVLAVLHTTWSTGSATVGIGLTVMVTVIGVPAQPLAVGVMVYVAVPAALPVAVNTCAIELPLPADAPLTPDWLTVQLKVVPATGLLSEMEGATPEHTVCDDGVAVTVGVGLTVMVTVIGVPAQPLAVGVMVYVAVPAALPVAVNTCAIELPLPADAPLTPDWLTVQLKVVPATGLLSEMEGAIPEHTVCDEGVAVTVGVGLTVMVTVTGVPAQPLAVGVMVYVAVPAALPVAVNTCAIELPLPADAPLTPDWLTVQLKVVPATGLLSAMEGATPEHTVCDDGVAVTVGVGLTVMVTVTGVPAQPLAVGVMVYVAVPAALPVAVNTCAIELPLPADAPLTPDWLTVQLKVVPATGLLSAIEGATPEHTVCDDGVAVTVGVGLITTVVVAVTAAHPPLAGVV